jgi:hypothetical protein
MHRLLAPSQFAFGHVVRVLLTAFLLWLPPHVGARETTHPVWLVSNGFHASIAVRARDWPFARKIDRRHLSSTLLIGWGSEDFYRGKVNMVTFLRSLFGIGPSLLHVIPIDGPPRARFRHSDIVQINIPAAKMNGLTGEIDRSFARTPDGFPMDEGRGYYPDSRFYLGSERFYFPYFCTTWVALKLRRAGVPICVPTAIIAGNLVREAAAFGQMQQRRGKPVDAF